MSQFRLSSVTLLWCTTAQCTLLRELNISAILLKHSHLACLWRKHAKIFAAVFSTGLLCTLVYEKSRFLIHISFYLANDTLHSYNVRRLGTRVCSLSNGAIFIDLEWPILRFQRHTVMRTFSGNLIYDYVFDLWLSVFNEVLFGHFFTCLIQIVWSNERYLC